MEPSVSLPHLQVPATCPYPEPDLSSPYPQPTSWRSILILSSHLPLGLPSVLFLPGFNTKTLYTPLLSLYVLNAPSISFFSIWSPEQYWARRTDHQVLPPLLSSLPSPVTSSLIGPNILLSTLFSNPSAYVPPSVWTTKFHTDTNKIGKIMTDTITPPFPQNIDLTPYITLYKGKSFNYITRRFDALTAVSERGWGMRHRVVWQRLINVSENKIIPWRQQQ